MATTHKLMSSGQLAAGTPDNIYDPSSVTGLVKTIVLHNMNTSTEPEVAKIFFNGTADSTRMLNVSLDAGETFEWSLSHMVVVAESEVLKGQATNPSKVNYFIFGAEES